ncbi:Detected protein of unknown function [Hibiscus syriacus]|uniref:Uncharacterized protein n=1 Tax=Hibiscus syriacus TaxID=106335 RepID=A0A6A2X416_HIBSY|nr:Detected protein of unknown function [Hibiscus syriacus]
MVNPTTQPTLAIWLSGKVHGSKLKLDWFENQRFVLVHINVSSLGVSPVPNTEFVGTTTGSSETVGIVKEEGKQEWKELGIPMEPNNINVNVGGIMEEGFINLLLNDSIDPTLLDSGKEFDENSGGSGDGRDYYEDNKNFWYSEFGELFPI